jgi:predicted transcriptional regulator
MTKRRDKTKIVYDILRIISKNNNSIKPTPLLRFSNLSFNLFNEYIGELIDKELVSVIEDKGKSYSLTEKGCKYLEKYKAVQEFIEEFLL